MQQLSIHRFPHLVAASGEVDLATAPDLAAALGEACADATEDVTVDLSDVTFMDSCGARALLRAVGLLPPGISLEVVGQRPIVDKALRILGFDAIKGIRLGPSSTDRACA